MNREFEIIAEIESAFDGSFEKPAKVTKYGVNDPEDYDGEGESVEEFYNQRDWKDVRFQCVGGYLISSYLKTEALLYYLPSILISILQDKNPKTDFTDCAFLYFGNPKWFDKRMERVKSALNERQKSVLVAAFVEANSWNGWYSQETEFITNKFKC